ncbi:MAG TPA: YncE family protein [Candidatus Angelobacter sp.]|nr:YncE family protein [Candidatus Angelobacter sp.]
MKKACLSIVCLIMAAASLPVRADSVLTTINVGSEPTGVAVNPITNKIYVQLDNTGQLAVIDGSTQQITAKIDVGAFAISVAINPVTNRIYASGCGLDPCNITVIDGNTNTVITRIPIDSGQFIGIQGIAVNPVTNRIYAVDADNAEYIVIDGNTNTILTEVPTFIFPIGVAVNPATNRIYIGDGAGAEVLVFDGATNAELDKAQTAAGDVDNLATNFRLDRTYATIDGSNVLSVINGRTNQEIAEAPAGPFPNGVDVNLLNNKVYVANSNGSSVTIINGNNNKVLQTLPIPATFPEQVAVNPVTGRTYVTDFFSGTVIVLQQ